MKAVGKGLGPLGVGIIAADNYKTYKGNTQKVVVGIAVDGTFSTGSAAVGAAVGSAFLPPIGTVVGAGVGIGANVLINRKYDGKSLPEKSKELINKQIKSTAKACKKISSSISGWFK